MAGWANNVANSEWEAYGMLVTQGLRADIPLTDKFGACSDSTSFKVAIIDSGLRADHPDVPCRIQESESNCIGKSFGMNETENPWHSPWNTWHGTHVFGPMGAIGGNGKGVTSMNPTDNNICWIIARTFPDEQSPNGVKLSDVYAGVNWALQQGAQVINMSLVGGYTETGQATMDAAAAAGAIVVASSGNSYTWQYEYPSSYESVLSVGAIGTNKYVSCTLHCGITCILDSVPFLTHFVSSPPRTRLSTENGPSSPLATLPSTLPALGCLFGAWIRRTVVPTDRTGMLLEPAWQRRM